MSDNHNRDNGKGHWLDARVRAVSINEEFIILREHMKKLPKYFKIPFILLSQWNQWKNM